jgi:hypothetical protein
MEKTLCAALYELELEKSPYSHPYHKLVFIKNSKSPKETIKRLRKPWAFTFESIPRSSLELKFKSNTPSYSPEPKKRPASCLKAKSKNHSGKFYLQDTGLLRYSIQACKDNTDNMIIRGSSANIIKRKANSNVFIRKKMNQKNMIKIKIKSVKHSVNVKKKA